LKNINFTHKKLLIVSFLIGFLALAVEILTMRALATVSGTSSISTSNAIAVVLIFLSLGYYLAGRVPSEKRQGYLFVGLLLTSLTIFISPAMLAILRDYSGTLNTDIFGFTVRTFVLSAVGAFLSAGIPSIFLGLSSPLVFSYLNEVIKNPQKTASQNFIFSGIGSLFGSITPNLVLVPTLGVSSSFFLLGCLALFGFLLLFYKLALPGEKAMAPTMLLPAVGLIVLFGFGKDRTPNTIARQDTPYQTIFVKEERFDSSDLRYLSYNLGLGIQSVYDPANRYIDDFYFDDLLIFLNKYLYQSSDASQQKQEIDILILGSAGGTVSTYIDRFYSDTFDLNITNVDIDPYIHDIAKEYFGAENPNTEFVTADGRTFVQSTQNKYDIVLIDLYTNELFIPNHVLTAEFAQELEGVLKADGVISFNVNAVTNDSDLMQTLAGSLKAHLDFVYFSSSEPGDTLELKNFLVTASNEQLDFDSMVERNSVDILDPEFRKIARNTVEVSNPKLKGKDDTVCAECLALDLALELNS
jgi:spermidine synthase/MFS family permease